MLLPAGWTIRSILFSILWPWDIQEFSRSTSKAKRFGDYPAIAPAVVQSWNTIRRTTCSSSQKVQSGWFLLWGLLLIFRVIQFNGYLSLNCLITSKSIIIAVMLKVVFPNYEFGLRLFLEVHIWNDSRSRETFNIVSAWRSSLKHLEWVYDSQRTSFKEW